jgi:hypothetical protein
MEVQIKNQTQIDRRIIKAVLRAVVERNSFVVLYRDIYGQLRRLVEDDDEFYKLEDAAYEAISEGLLRGVYKLPGPCEDSSCDIVVASPEPLSREVLDVVEHLAGLYQFKLYDGKRSEVARVLHNFVKMQVSGCLEAASPAKAVYSLAKTYGLAVQEEAQLDEWHVGEIIYKIEGLNRPVVKEVYYCNNCVNFHINDQFIEKCRSWRFAE